MNGTREDGMFVLATTKDSKIKALEAKIAKLENNLEGVNFVYEKAKTHIEVLEADIMDYQANLAIASEAFDRLSKLGNGDRVGNSIGNDIALEARNKELEERHKRDSEEYHLMHIALEARNKELVEALEMLKSHEHSMASGRAIASKALAEQPTQEPLYFGLTLEHTWLSVSEEIYNTMADENRMKVRRVK